MEIISKTLCRPTIFLFSPWTIQDAKANLADIKSKFDSTVDWASSKMTESTVGLRRLEDFRMTREKIEAEKDAMDKAARDDEEKRRKCVCVCVCVPFCVSLALRVHADNLEDLLKTNHLSLSLSFSLSLSLCVCMSVSVSVYLSVSVSLCVMERCVGE